MLEVKCKVLFRSQISLIQEQLPLRRKSLLLKWRMFDGGYFLVTLENGKVTVIIKSTVALLALTDSNCNF